MKNIKPNKGTLLYTCLLILSLLLFFMKGIRYAIIGSYAPILICSTLMLIFYLSRQRKKTLNVVLKIWSILIIGWSSMRLLIGAVDHFGKELMEHHLQENLGILGTLISIAFLIGGFFLLNKKQRNEWLLSRTKKNCLSTRTDRQPE